jgi:single-strand DNA-binding protein
MQSMNRVTLVGHLGNDPETHTFTSGDVRTAFNLATSESWTIPG